MINILKRFIIKRYCYLLRAQDLLIDRPVQSKNRRSGGPLGPSMFIILDPTARFARFRTTDWVALLASGRQTGSLSSPQDDELRSLLSPDEL